MNRLARRITLLAAIGGLTAAGVAPALANGRTSPSISFFAGGGGSAHWTQATSNDADPFSVQLDVPGVTGYAGADLHHQSGQPAPALPPSFDFKSNVTGASGGSPRLVITFSDGGNIDLRPLATTANTWQHEDGAGTDWDNSGGTCGFVYEQSYAVVTACHAGADVTDAFVVSDSGWLYTSGYTNWIDNIQYNGTVLSQPSDNGN